jgi:hypothetical protein
LERWRRAPHSPGYDVVEMRLEPGAPQQIAGGGIVAIATTLRKVGQVTGLEKSEDAHLGTGTKFPSARFHVYEGERVRIVLWGGKGREG